MVEAKDLLDPEVLAPIIDNTFAANMVFSPLADFDRTLEGKPGDTLTMPLWTHSGEAQVVAEGAQIPLDAKVGQGQVSVKVQKFGLGVPVTDESILFGLNGDQVIQQATTQLGRSLAQYADNSLLNAISASADVNKLAGVTLDVDGIDGMEGVFASQNANPAYTIITSPKTGLVLRKAVRDYLRGTETGAQLVVSGAVPLVLGASLVTTNKMGDNQAIMIYSSSDDIAAAKEKASATTPQELEALNSGAALKYVVKRDQLVETERKPGTNTTNIYASQIAASYVYNPAKIVVATLAGGSTTGGSTSGSSKSSGSSK